MEVYTDSHHSEITQVMCTINYIPTISPWIIYFVLEAFLMSLSSGGGSWVLIGLEHFKSSFFFIKAAFIMYATGGGRGFFFQRLVFLYPPPRSIQIFRTPQAISRKINTPPPPLPPPKKYQNKYLYNCVRRTRPNTVLIRDS